MGAGEFVEGFRGRHRGGQGGGAPHIDFHFNSAFSLQKKKKKKEKKEKK